MQAESKDRSKRTHEARTQGNDGIYARLRRLERELELLRLKVGNCQRDVYRIEKQHSRAKQLPSVNDQPSGGQLPPGLFQ